LEHAVSAAREKFEAEMDDDFNTAAALGAVFELAKAANVFLAEYQADLCEQDRGTLLAAEEAVTELLGVLGIEVEEESEVAWPREVCDLAEEVCSWSGEDPEIAVEMLLAERTAARSGKDWAKADRVRDGLADLGFVIEDTVQGPRVLYRPE
jgi:cysteinyl-tRNA synthetase